MREMGLSDVAFLNDQGPHAIDPFEKVPVAFPLIGFVIRRLHFDPGRVLVKSVWRWARGARVRIPGYFLRGRLCCAKRKMRTLADHVGHAETSRRSPWLETMRSPIGLGGVIAGMRSNWFQ